MYNIVSLGSLLESGRQAKKFHSVTVYTKYGNLFFKRQKILQLGKLFCSAQRAGFYKKILSYVKISFPESADFRDCFN